MSDPDNIERYHAPPSRAWPCDVCGDLIAFGEVHDCGRCATPWASRRVIEAEAEVERLREALEDIAHDEGTPGDPGWRRAMEALGLDAEAAERAWQD